MKVLLYSNKLTIWKQNKKQKRQKSNRKWCNAHHTFIFFFFFWLICLSLWKDGSLYKKSWNRWVEPSLRPFNFLMYKICQRQWVKRTLNNQPFIAGWAVHLFLQSIYWWCRSALYAGRAPAIRRLWSEQSYHRYRYVQRKTRKGEMWKAGKRQAVFWKEKEIWWGMKKWSNM